MTRFTDDQTKIVLAVAMSYDNRKTPGEANRAAWAEVSERGRWGTVAAAVEAVHTHYAATTDFLMPGHITQLIRADKRQPPRIKTVVPPALAAGFTRALPTLPTEDDGQPGRWWKPGSHKKKLTAAGRAQALAELEAARQARQVELP